MSAAITQTIFIAIRSSIGLLIILAEPKSRGFETGGCEGLIPIIDHEGGNFFCITKERALANIPVPLRSCGRQKPHRP